MICSKNKWLDIFFIGMIGYVAPAFCDTLSLRGKVVDAASIPIAGAIVSVMGQVIADTTGTDGVFSISKAGITRVLNDGTLQNTLQRPFFVNGMLSYAVLSDAKDVIFSLVSLTGVTVLSIRQGKQARGTYAVDIGRRAAQAHIAAGLYLLTGSIGQTTLSSRVMVLSSLSAAGPLKVTTVTGPLRKALVAETIDTILVIRDGYYDKKTPLQRYTADLGAIALDKIGSGSDYPGGQIVAYPFPLATVRLNPGTRLDSLRRKNSTYLQSIENDRLLYFFRQTAGLATPGTPLGGWESQGVRGHFAGGHMLSACAKAWASSRDSLLLNKGNTLVTELGKCQDKMGTGYLFASGSSFFDHLETGSVREWAPYYTAHKIMAGLLDMCNLCGNTQALDICKKMASYFKGRMDKLPPSTIDRILETRFTVAGENCYTNEFGGMGEVMHDLYKVTHDADHLAFAHVFDRPWFTNMLSGNNDLLGFYSLHANTHIPMVLSLGSRYEITGESVCRSALINFCDMMQSHTWAHGGASGMPPDHNRENCENYSYPDQWYDQMASGDQAENCCAHNLNEISGKAFSYTADPHYADDFEKRLVNVAMSQQGANGGQYTYFLRTRQGAVKSYGDALNTFWCCYGTGVEAYETFADGAYFYDRQRTIWINQFIASTVTWADKGLTIKQVTNFPEEQGSRFEFTLTSPQNLKVMIRVPYWAVSGVAVSINGATLSGTFAPSSFIALDRTWINGDVVQLTLPFNLYTARLVDRPEYVGIKYGPELLVAVAPANTAFNGTEAQLVAALAPVAGKACTFMANLSTGTVTFKPINRIAGETYNGYTIIKTPVASMTVDSVVIGNSASESGHAFKSTSSTTGSANGRTYRAASPAGSFSYTMEVDPEKKMQVQCTYWGGDNTNRQFYIQVDEQYLTTQVLQNNFPNTFFYMNYPVPDRFLSGKKSVVITFRPKAGNTAGGVYDLKTFYAD